MSGNKTNGDEPAPTRVRYAVLVLIGLAPGCAYLPRVISAFNTTLTAQFHVSNEEIGDVIAGFALGYFFFQVPGGMLAGRYGVRRVLSAMGLVWSGCAVWGSLARSADELYYSRVCLGVAQAGLVPCCAKVAADWFPIARRGLVSAVLTGSMQVGAIAATGLSARLLDSVGWRLLLLVYALTGIVWSAVFFTWFRNQPEKHPATNAAERALIRAGRTPEEPKSTDALPTSGRAPWLRLMLALSLSVSLWAYYVQAVFRTYAQMFFRSWCPAFLENAYGLDKAAAGELAAWPLLAIGVGSVLGGFVVDALLVRTGSRWLSRCGSSIVGLGACAACFAAATLVRDANLVIALLSLGCLLSALSGPATWAAGMDLGGKHTAVVFGLMNTIGNLGGYLCPRQVGRLFDHVQASSGDWNLVLWLFVGINLAAAAAWLFVNPRHPIPE